MFEKDDYISYRVVGDGALSTKHGFLESKQNVGYAVVGWFIGVLVER